MNKKNIVVNCMIFRNNNSKRNQEKKEEKREVSNKLKSIKWQSNIIYSLNQMYREYIIKSSTLYELMNEDVLKWIITQI